MGAEVRTLKKGDRVATLLTNACGACDRCLTGQEHRCLHGQGIGHSADGGFAEFVKVSGFSAVKVPSGMPFEQACLLGCPIGVAYHALKGIARVQAGETALVTGAGGGLGVHSIQLLRAFGAQVLAATTSPEKVEGLQELGADSVILSPEMDFHWEVLALTQERGVEVVVDTVGSRVSQPCYDSLAQFGRWVLLGEIQGGTMNVNPALLIFKDRRLLASSGASRRDLLDSARLVRTGRVIPKVQAFSLREAKRAFELLEQRRLFGRAVLIP